MASARPHLPIVQLPVNVDLPFSDVARQVRNRMGDICRTNTSPLLLSFAKAGQIAWVNLRRTALILLTIVRHGQDGDLGDRPITALHPPRPL